MESITEILKTIGLPALITIVSWLLKLESQVHNNKDKISLLDEQINKKMTDTLDSISKSIQLLTTSITKHDIMLENVQNKVVELANDVKNRPCVAHNN